MSNATDRALTSQLAEDLAWLEEHCRDQPEAVTHVSELRVASALVRNCIGPFLDGQPATPLHLAVVGGAGTGKSTVVNFLSGSVVAEANPQAGYTRHPIAFAQSQSEPWTGHSGFLGPLRLIGESQPSNLDSDVYQVRHVSLDGEFSLLHQFVIWDCPDMTTWAATGYVPRLLEVVALADVIVYVASDERYNDEVPTQFLNLLLRTGKPIVACLTKMAEANVAAILTHFEHEVLARMPGPVVSCMAIPQLTAGQLADPLNQAKRHRIPLLNQIAVLGEDPARTRSHSVRAATNHLVASQERLMNAARNDIAALEGWRSVVQLGQSEFNERYRREFLMGEKFHRFDEALVRLLDMLELPGIGKFLSGALWVLRTPYRLLKGAMTKALSRPEPPSMPELPVMERALAGWLEMLHKEAARRADTHPVWELVEKGFHEDLRAQADERFHQGFRGFHMAISDEVDRTARAIYEDLERQPVKLISLRTGKFALDVGAIAGAVVMGGPGWNDVILVPLAASVSHMLIEFFGHQYVEVQREEARRRQEALVSQFVSSPVAEWLIQWPTSGGSRFERLQAALRRFPQAIRQLDVAVTKALSAKS